MLVLGERLQHVPVMSLQVGGKIAETATPVIDPRTLSILAYEVDGPLLNKRPSFIRIADIRELGELGLIVDSSDELIGEDDVLKIKEVRDFHFELIGIHVVDTNGKKLGRVIDYTVDTDSFVIQQLSVRAGLFGSLSSTGHMIHRSQITEISETTITVRGTDKKLPSLETTGTIHRTYSNPFRQSGEPQPDTSTPSQS